MSARAAAKTKDAPRLVAEEERPIPRNQALATVPAVPVRRDDAAHSGNPFADDWALEDYLLRSGLEILDMDDVCSKMDRLAKRQHQRWGWYSLRPQDRINGSWTHGYQVGYDRHSAGAIVHGHLARTVYSLAVPESVWALIGRIELGFPGAVFLVSHYAAHVPDPFLAVTVTGRELYVIAEWQQPGRREQMVKRQPFRIELFGLPLRFWGFLAVVMVAMWVLR